MNAIADTASRTDRRSLRAYLAGGTATSALIAGAAVVFISLAAYVAFNGLGAGADTARNHDAVVIASRGAPAAAAAAAGGAPAAVAARPTAPTAAAPTAATTTASPATPAAAGSADAGSVDGGSLDGSTSGGTASSGSAATGSSSGTLGNAVGGVSNTASNLGVPNDPSGIQNIVKPVDDTVNQTLNNVGGLLGNPDLGNEVNDTVNGVTNGLLGPSGVTGNLLGN